MKSILQIASQKLSQYFSPAFAIDKFIKASSLAFEFYLWVNIYQ